MMLTALAFFATAATAGKCPLPSERPMLEVQLLFGRDIPGGGTVSDAQWSDFAATIVTPKFPDGFSVTDSKGQWRDKQTGKIIREPSEVVVIVTAEEPTLESKIQKIVDAYRARFHQQSVGVVTRPACAAF
jgi:hypothetical protein